MTRTIFILIFAWRFLVGCNSPSEYSYMSGKWALIEVDLSNDSIQTSLNERLSLGRATTFFPDGSLHLKMSHHVTITGEYKFNESMDRIIISDLKENCLNGKYEFKIIVRSENYLARTENLYLRNGENYLSFQRVDNRELHESIVETLKIKR